MLHVEQLVVKISASFLEVANFYLVLGGVGGWGGGLLARGSYRIPGLPGSNTVLIH